MRVRLGSRGPPGRSQGRRIACWDRRLPARALTWEFVSGGEGCVE
jgi:hypothetical protein